METSRPAGPLQAESRRRTMQRPQAQSISRRIVGSLTVCEGAVTCKATVYRAPPDSSPTTCLSLGWNVDSTLVREGHRFVARCCPRALRCRAQREFPWRHAVTLLEYAAEMRGVQEAAPIGHVADHQLRNIREQLSCVLDSQRVRIAHGRQTFGLQCARQTTCRNVDRGGQARHVE